MNTFSYLRIKIWHSKSASIIKFWSILVVFSSIEMISWNSITYLVICDNKSGCTDHTVHSVVKGKHGLHSNGGLLLFNNHLLSLISLSTFLPFFSTQLNNTVIWFWGFIFWKVTCINTIKIMEGKIPLKYIVFKFFSQHLYATKKKTLIHIKQI